MEIILDGSEPQDYNNVQLNHRLQIRKMVALPAGKHMWCHKSFRPSYKKNEMGEVVFSFAHSAAFSAKKIKIRKRSMFMKVYKQIMNIITKIEELVLALATLLVLVLTFGNVIARKVFNHSWGFTEEIVIAVFVLIALVAAGVAARSGDLVNLGLLPDAVDLRGKKILSVISTVISVIYSIILAYQGWGRVVAVNTFSPILHISTKIFWSFVLIGGISLALHFVENCLDFCLSNDEEGA